MKLTRELIERRAAVLRQERDQRLADLNACIGALREVERLAELADAEAAAEPVNGDRVTAQ